MSGASTLSESRKRADFYDKLVNDFEADIRELSAGLEIDVDVYRDRVRESAHNLAGKRKPIGYKETDIGDQRTGALFFSDGSRMVGCKFVREGGGVVYEWAVTLQFLDPNGKGLGSQLIEHYGVADGWPGD